MGSVKYIPVGISYRDFAWYVDDLVTENHTATFLLGTDVASNNSYNYFRRYAKIVKFVFACSLTAQVAANGVQLLHITNTNFVPITRTVQYISYVGTYIIGSTTNNYANCVLAPNSEGYIVSATGTGKITGNILCEGVYII